MRPLGQLATWSPTAPPERVEGQADEPQDAPRPLGQVRTWTHSERGSGTVWTLGLGAVLMMAGLLLAAISTAVAATQRADSAADLAALSGARLLLDGEGRACAQARSVARANGAELTRCCSTEESIDVAVKAQSGSIFGTRVTVHARARAGPTKAFSEMTMVFLRAENEGR